MTTIKTANDGAVDVAQDTIFTLQDLLKLLKISRNTLLRVVREGDFPEPLTIAGQKRWSSSMINDYILINNPSLRRRQALIANAEKSITSAQEL